MPEETTIRRTTTVESTSVESDEVKRRLKNVQEELKNIEHEVRKDAESLNRLRSMLDFSHLEEIMRVIADLELRVSEVASEAERAKRRAEEAESQLREEQQRLEKLWDVYKVQETEVEDLKAERTRLSREVTTLTDRLRVIENERDAERRALRQAQEEAGNIRQRLADAEARTEQLRSYEQFQTKATDLERQLNEERERLTKLYAVYEETEAERDDMSARLRQWDSWFSAHETSMKGVCRAVNEAPR